MKQKNNQLRIIGGCWRGRRLHFLDQPGLRPTPDRVRETLFNWLMPVLPNARCLDAFAGSGALGFEACSRGAREVILLEQSAQNICQLKINAQKLGNPEQLIIQQTDTLSWLSKPKEPFDIIFLDPPFNHNLLSITIKILIKFNWLKPNGYLYLETQIKDNFFILTNNLKFIRENTAGQVKYGLAVYK